MLVVAGRLATYEKINIYTIFTLMFQLGITSLHDWLVRVHICKKKYTSKTVLTNNQLFWKLDVFLTITLFGDT